VKTLSLEKMKVAPQMPHPNLTPYYYSTLFYNFSTTTDLIIKAMNPYNPNTLKRQLEVDRNGLSHWRTPKRVKIQEDVDFINRHKIKYPKINNSAISFPKNQVF
jgi:hypothetical protein